MKHAYYSLSVIPEMRSVMERAYGTKGRMQPGGVYPPLFVVFPRSVEPEYVMDGLCDDLEALGQVEFTGSRRWLNGKLEYTEGVEFPSFAMMLECMHKNAGYRNEFGGLVRLDMTDWMEHVNDSRVGDVFAYVHDYCDRVLFLVSVTTDDEKLAKALRTEFTRWVYALTVNVNPPTAECLTEAIVGKLCAGGHTVAADARALLLQSVALLAAQKKFAGLREIDGLASAILAETASVRNVCARHLAAFAPDGQWIAARVSQEDNDEFTIGF